MANADVCKRIATDSERDWKTKQWYSDLPLAWWRARQATDCLDRKRDMLENVWIWFFVFAAAEHAGWNRAKGGSLVRIVCAQRELAYGGEGSHQRWGRTAGCEAQDTEGQPSGATESAPWQTDQHSGKWLFLTGFTVGRRLGDFIAVLCN